MFIAKHNDEEKAQESEQRNRRLENEATRVELRVAVSIPSSDAAASTSHLAMPRGADNDLSGARDPGSASTLGMFSPAVSTGLDSAREPGPSTATACYRVQSWHSKRARAGGASREHGFFLDDTLAARSAYPGLYAQDHTR
jgi:hypothetical protein